MPVSFLCMFIIEARTERHEEKEEADWVSKGCQRELLKIPPPKLGSIKKKMLNLYNSLFISKIKEIWEGGLRTNLSFNTTNINWMPFMGKVYLR